METQRERAKILARSQGITKEIFCQKTGYSVDQWYYWFGAGNRISSPSVDQLGHICECLDWSPNFIFFGIGSASLREVKTNSDRQSLPESIARLEKYLLEQQQVLTALLNKVDKLAVKLAE